MSYRNVKVYCLVSLKVLSEGLSDLGEYSVEIICSGYSNPGYAGLNRIIIQQNRSPVMVPWQNHDKMEDLFFLAKAGITTIQLILDVTDVRVFWVIFHTPLVQSGIFHESNLGGPEKGRVDLSKRTYARSPRIRRASWISFGIMVTLLAWIAHKLVSSKMPTK